MILLGIWELVLYKSKLDIWLKTNIIYFTIWLISTESCTLVKRLIKLIMQIYYFGQHFDISYAVSRCIMAVAIRATMVFYINKLLRFFLPLLLLILQRAFSTYSLCYCQVVDYEAYQCCKSCHSHCFGNVDYYSCSLVLAEPHLLL